MEYVQLGLTPLNISRVGFGCAAIGGHDYGKVDDRDSIAAVGKALDLGINFFDTADVYGLGHAEEVLGKALGPRRHDVVVATKFGLKWDEQGRTTRDISPERVMEALEASLHRLKLDSIPLYQIHWPDGKTPIVETMQALSKCQRSGKIRFIGCCNFPPDLVDEAQEYARLESLQVPYSLSERDYESVMHHCNQKHHMAILCYNLLAQGLFTGKYGRDSKFEGTDLRRRSYFFHGDKLENNLALLNRLKTVGDCHARTPAQVAIRWVLNDRSVTCAITGVKNPVQIEENAAVLGWNLSPTDMTFLSRG